VVVDFDRWIADVDLSLQQWNEAVYAIGEEKFPFASSEERDGWTTNPHILRVVGAKPRWTREQLEKARDGDPELLNIVPPEPVVKKLDWVSFVQSMKGQGYSPTELGALYREGKTSVLGGVA